MALAKQKTTEAISIIEDYSKKFRLLLKKRAPQLKKIHIGSFPAIHLKKMDWFDYAWKFSAELLVIVIAVAVAGCNVYLFSGASSAARGDNSLAADFLNNHVALNPKLYAKNGQIVTTVEQGNPFITEASADDFAGLANQGQSSQTGDSSDTVSNGYLSAPNPDSIKDLVAKQIKVYQTQSGDTLASIAAANGISQQTIIWANNLPNSTIQPGWYLLIPPVDGIIVTANSNTTLPDIAYDYSPERYNSNAQVRQNAENNLLNTIISYNGLADAEDIDAGQIVIVPGGVIAQPPAPPKPKAPSDNYNPNTVTSVGPGYNGENHLFPVGYCTYYVATKMKITFGGDAKYWIANARASGYVTGQTPAVHSAVVFSGSGYGRHGHVAYVEEVGDGKILVSEMNFDAFDRVDERWVSTSDSHIKGYIYQ